MLKIKRHPLSSIGILFLFVWMLISPYQVFLGAKNGLLLWYQTILPTLLPFSVISNILIETGSLYYISNAVGPLLRPFFRVSPAGVFAVVIGFLCGYPLGAKVVGQLYMNDFITKEEAEYLLSFCNNVSPIFLTNYVVMSVLRRNDLLLSVLLIMIGAPIFCSFIFRNIGSTHSHTSKKETAIQVKSFHLSTFHKCLMDGCEMMVYLGGYIIAFSILFTLLSKLTNIPIFTYLLPFLEVTNGIAAIQTFPLTFSQKFIFTLAISAFGGICAIFQTQMVLSKTTLSMPKYVIKKLVTMMVTSLFAYLYLLFV